MTTDLEVLLAGGVRTPIGSFLGTLSDVPAPALGSVVVREALAALADGKSRLIGLSPNPEADRRPGIDIFPMTCHSGGTVEIYIDPLLPPVWASFSTLPGFIPLA